MESGDSLKTAADGGNGSASESRCSASTIPNEQGTSSSEATSDNSHSTTVTAPRSGEFISSSSPSSDCGPSMNERGEPTTSSTDDGPVSGDDTSQASAAALAAAAAAAAKNIGGSGKMNPQTVQKMEEIRRAMEMLIMQSGGAAGSAPRSTEEAQHKRYEFWETQPVPRLDENPGENGPIEPDKKREEVRQEPYRLPEGFGWDTLDIADDHVLKELYTLLNENYVEDDDNMFRFDYSPEFLRWALKPPGWLPDWHVGVRVTKSSKLVGFISAIPAHIRVYDKQVKVVEINFLCVHKKLRSKRMTPVLIKEITRRVNLTGIFQAVYTAGVVLPKPVGTCRYWHRSLNPKKLIDVKFSHLGKNMTMQRTVKLYKLPDATLSAGFRKLEQKDLKKVKVMLNDYLKKFGLSPIFTDAEVAHWFSPQKDIVDSYVVERKDDKGSLKLIGFASFYTLPSTVMHHPVHKSIKAAYSFYNVAKESEGLTINDLMHDCLIMAKVDGYDVFNALDLMDNKQFLEKQKFGIGDGNLQYYLFNWKCPSMAAEQIGLVLQ